MLTAPSPAGLCSDSRELQRVGEKRAGALTQHRCPPPQGQMQEAASAFLTFPKGDMKHLPSAPRTGRSRSLQGAASWAKRPVRSQWEASTFAVLVSTGPQVATSGPPRQGIPLPSPQLEATDPSQEGQTPHKYPEDASTRLGGGSLTCALQGIGFPTSSLACAWEGEVAVARQRSAASAPAAGVGLVLSHGQLPARLGLPVAGLIPGARETPV